MNIDKSKTSLSFRSDRVILIADIVDSVRHYDLDEAGAVGRWALLLQSLRQDILNREAGRFVKSTGDGFILEFSDVSASLRVAKAIHAQIGIINTEHPSKANLALRIGINISDVYSDDVDVYGRGVNFAARIASLARPGETVISASVRDRLIPGLDPEVEDIGPSFFKNSVEPITVYRVSDVDPKARQIRIDPFGLDLLPAIAVVPFAGLMVESPHDVVGELLADALIARMSTARALRVISRLSTSKIQGKALNSAEISRILGANYVLSGSYRVQAEIVTLVAELVVAGQLTSLWVREFHCSIDELLQSNPEICLEISGLVVDAIAEWELGRFKRTPLPSLEGFSIQLAGISMMYRSSVREFQDSKVTFEALVERYPRAPEPRAWLAKWYVLRVTRGLVPAAEAEPQRALEHTRRALDENPSHAFALAVEGFIHIHLIRDLEVADRRLDDSLAVNPSEPLAWLFKSVSQSFRGDGAAALTSAESAIALSPIDPLHHYYDALASTAALAAGKYERAEELARRALSYNRAHPPTLRGLCVAQVELGDLEAAKRTVGRILELDPDYSICKFLSLTPRGSGSNRGRYADALERAGIPKN